MSVIRCIIAVLLAIGALLRFTPLSEAAPHDVKNGDINLKVLTQQGSSENEVHLKIATAKINRSSVFVLENPARIVVDLFGPLAKKNSELPVQDKIVSAVRVGAHADKTRIVADLVEKTVPPYSWNESKEGAVLKINFSPLKGTEDLVPPVDNIANDASPIPAESVPSKVMPPAISDESPLEEILPRSPLPTHTATAIPTVAPTQAATVPEPEPSSTTAPGETAIPDAPESQITATTPGPVSVSEPSVIAKDEIAALEFGYSGDPHAAPTIKLKLGSKTEFELKKIDEKTYKLQIPNTRLLRPALKLPQFPPHDFLGFSVILLRQFDSGVEATIGVERGVRISVAPNQNEIWIKTIGGSKTLTQSPPKPKQGTGK